MLGHRPVGRAQVPADTIATRRKTDLEISGACRCFESLRLGFAVTQLPVKRQCLLKRLQRHSVLTLTALGDADVV